MTSNNMIGSLPAGDQMRQQMRQAEQAFRAGQFEAAEQMCRSILARTPGQSTALQILGLSLARRGEHEGAETALRQSIAINPRSSSTHVNLGNVCSLRGDFTQAEASYRAALALTPNHPEALFNLGLALKSQARLEEAKTALSKAIAAKPDYTDAIVQYGVVLMSLDDLKAALDAFARAIAQRDLHFEAHYNRGIALMKLDRWEEAKLSLARAGAINDRSHETFLALGKTLHRLQNLTLATSALARAAALKPESAEAHAMLAMVFLEEGWTKAAADEIAKAIAIEPEHAEYHTAHAQILADLNRLDEAAEANNRAAALAPDSPEVMNALGRSRLSMGRMDEAREIFQRARVLHEDNIQVHLNLARVDKFKPGDERLAKLESFLDPEDRLNPDERAALHFVLGKAYDDLGDYDRAFDHFVRANTEQRRLSADTEPDDIDMLERIRRVYSKEFFRTRAGKGSDSAVPIFVLGMPRSGTTLAEQIISSHPLVAGAGEVKDLEIATNIVTTRRKLSGRMPELVAQMTDADLRDIGGTYVERLRERAPGASRITDKMLGNYNRIGLIHLALPNAKIIHCLRNPIDCCLSIYTNPFAVNAFHANDMAHLGRFYRNYHAMMAHWREVLPGSFLDVPYEETVRDLESAARRIIAHCGLEWDPRCLEFDKNERRVVTLSITQVRQPVYKSSVERWRNYEKHLGPLIENLGDLAPK